MDKIIQKITQEITKEQYCSAHSVDHVWRVYKLCLALAKEQKIDKQVLQIAALLHDIGGAAEMADPTGKTDHAVVSAQMAEKILQGMNFPEQKISHIKDCIISHRYKTNNKPRTLEAKILFDADKLDGVGAIGVARVFVWMGRNRGNIYKKVNLRQYIKDNLGGRKDGRIQDKTKHSPQIEYGIKVKYLLTRLYTPTAKKICAKRVKYFKDFLDQLEKEYFGGL